MAETLLSDMSDAEAWRRFANTTVVILAVEAGTLSRFDGCQLLGVKRREFEKIRQAGLEAAQALWSAHRRGQKST